MMRSAAFLLLSSLAAHAQGESFAREIDAGRKAFEASKYEDAQTHFNKARMLRPDDWRGHAYQAFTLIQQAVAADERRRTALLHEADEVTGVLLKRRIILFQDPLYKYLQGMIYSVAGNHTKAFQFLEEALKTPRRKFAPYAEIELRPNVERGFAKTSVLVATHLMMVGGFQQADLLLEEAEKLMPESDPYRATLERQIAAVSEHLNKRAKAIEHLRKSIRLSKGEPGVKEELTGNIAMIYFVGQQFDEGRKALEALPADSRHPEIVAARAMMHYQLALKEPDGEPMEVALDYYRKAISEFPADDRQRLVTPYAELVLAKVGPRNAAQEKDLLVGTTKLLLAEIDIRPECASLYYHLYKIYKLLGDAKKEIYYQDLHTRKKDEWKLKHKEQYDDRGRPRCR